MNPVLTNTIPALPCAHGQGKYEDVKDEDVKLLLSICAISKMNTVRPRQTQRKCDMKNKRDEDMSTHIPLQTSGVRKHSKGGRSIDPACDAWRGVVYVPAYGIGMFKNMWKIDPYGVEMPPQTKKTFETLFELIKESVVTYAVEPYIGHPWFTHQMDGKIRSLESITITVEQHLRLWKSVCSIRADVTKKKRAVNRIIIKAGFGQTALCDGSGRVKFTFSSEKWMKHAPSLMKDGVGCGNSPTKGRPTPVAIYENQ